MKLVQYSSDFFIYSPCDYDIQNWLVLLWSSTISFIYSYPTIIRKNFLTPREHAEIYTLFVFL